MRETQRLDWRDGGAELVVHSEPRIKVPGGAQFTTTARFHIRPRAANGDVAGCTVRLCIPMQPCLVKHVG